MKLIMKYAEIKVNVQKWDFTHTFFILRAAHYLAEFENAAELRLNCADPGEAVRAEWNKYPGYAERRIIITFNHDMPDVPEFKSPEFALRINGKERLELGIPDIPGLTDFHVHSPLAYCSQNTEIEKVLKMEELSGVKHIHIAEHSGQLYCDAETYWNARFRWISRNPGVDRTELYRKMTAEQPGPIYGLELDIDEDLNVSDIPGIGGFRLGAVHFPGSGSTLTEWKENYMRHLDGLLAHGIHILAHPFRVFPRSCRIPAPEELFEPVAERLVKAGVAAEINFHANRPHPEFLELVLKKGGKVSFGTDTHNLYEAGYLKPHYELCKQLGIAGKLDQYLLSAESIKNNPER